MNVPDEVMKRMLQFLNDLRDPEAFGFAVTEEVREEARQIYFDFHYKKD